MTPAVELIPFSLVLGDENSLHLWTVSFPPLSITFVKAYVGLFTDPFTNRLIIGYMNI